MQRDPAFALAVGSLERCLIVRERVGSSLIVGRPGKPSGSDGFDAAVCEKEFKGPVTDFSATLVEVVRRSDAVRGSAIRQLEKLLASRQSLVLVRRTVLCPKCVGWRMVLRAAFARRLASGVTLEPRLRM